MKACPGEPSHVWHYKGSVLPSSPSARQALRCRRAKNFSLFVFSWLELFTNNPADSVAIREISVLKELSHKNIVR